MLSSERRAGSIYRKKTFHFKLALNLLQLSDSHPAHPQRNTAGKAFVSCVAAQFVPNEAPSPWHVASARAEKDTSSCIAMQRQATNDLVSCKLLFLHPSSSEPYLGDASLPEHAFLQLRRGASVRSRVVSCDDKRPMATCLKPIAHQS